MPGQPPYVEVCVDVATVEKVKLWVSHRAAIDSARLLRMYASVDVRVRQLGVVVKAWSHCRGVVGADCTCHWVLGRGCA